MRAGADRLRPEWGSLPASLRARIADTLGGDIVIDSPAQGGFSAGYAGIVRTAHAEAFVKAIGATGHRDSRTFIRREIRALQAIPASLAPRVLASIDDEESTALVLEVVPGIHPGDPWTIEQLHVVAAEIARLARTPAAESIFPAERSMLPYYARWQTIAEDAALTASLPHDLAERMPDLLRLEQLLPDAVTGPFLAHGDLRADNILIDGERAHFIDWPHARRGAAWLDGPLLPPSVEASGGPRCADAWEILRVHGAPDAASMLPVISGFASFLWWGQGQPEIPELPGLRAFQRAQARPLLRWLAELL
jgi:hypothetical protein